MYLKQLFRQSFSYSTLSRSSLTPLSSLNAISLYFQRSQLISSLKHALKSNASLKSLTSLVNTPLLDSFVVSRALQYAPSADSALSLVKILKKVPHFSHSRTTLKALGIVLARFRRFSELQGLIDSIRNNEFPGVSKESIDMDEFMWYAASGDVDSVLRLWDKTKGRRGRRCIEAYNILMGVHAKAGNDFEAVKVFYKMMEENAVPNPRTYAIIIEHLVSSSKLDSAIEVFHILPRMRIKRSSRMYSALLKGFVDARRFEVVSDLRNEMQIDGVLLPLRQCSHEEGEDDDDEDEDGGDVELASKIKFDPEILSALDDTNLAWTSVLVCKILWRMLPDNSVDDIWAFYCWLGNKPGRFTHDAYTASTMLKILTLRWSRGFYGEAREKRFKDYWDGELVTKLKEDGISLSYVTLNYIIDRRKVRGILRLFRRAEEICHPLSKFHHMILYSSLMRRVSRRQYVVLRGPLDFLDEMILRGILPDIPTFTGLMQYFSVKKDLRTVLKLFRMVQRNNLKPDAFMFQILIRAYLRRGKVDRAFKTFQDMRDSNFMPDSATKAVLVKHLSKEGMLEEVTVVEAGNEEINHLPPLPLNGYIWNVSSFDLKRVYDIYFDSFRATTS
ncbi:pentatricopeptide repeat-containing protein At5g66631-like [Corylus avellana]|uniref:pentatricopeptide repeat-containing protein At5g66631-like n=1 Tax=Corylus avellana TaxID=13451 RepID=UPI00286B1FB1|nr:pentatricopeptide repeat-containing protein At5g66631-like [Corylus avellana]